MTAPHIALTPLTLTINSQQIPQTPDGATSWVGQNAAVLPGVALADRLKLLEVLATGLRGGSAVQQCSLTEIAAVKLLKDIQGNNESMTAAARAVGGADWLQTNLNRFENPELKAMALIMTNLVRAPVAG